MSSDNDKKQSTYMTRANDGTVPVAHHDIVAIFQAIGTRAVTDALLALLEFLQ